MLALVLDGTPRPVHIHPSYRAAVLGDGKVGLLARQVVAVTGAHVHLVGSHPEKLALAAGWGITIKPPIDRVDVDCTGNPTGYSAALESVRPRGTVVLKSTYPFEEAIAALKHAEQRGAF